VKTLVCGGAGFVGSTVVDRLIAHGHEVTVLDDLSSGRLVNLEQARREQRIGFHRFDVRSDAVRDVISHARPDVVLHLAAQVSVPVSVGRPLLDANTNVVGLLNVLDACAAAGVGKVVYAATAAMYGPQRKLPIPESARARPASPHGIASRAACDYLRFYAEHHDLDFTALVLSNVYGPRQRFDAETGVVAAMAAALSAGRAPSIHGTGLATRDFVYVDDVAHAFVLACERGSGEVVNISTGIETTVNRLHRMVAEVTGASVEPVHGPARPGDLLALSLDPSRAATVLGWEPWTPLGDGLRSTVAWVRTELKASGEIG